jgi:hypothetical protein
MSREPLNTRLLGLARRGTRKESEPVRSHQATLEGDHIYLSLSVINNSPDTVSLANFVQTDMNIPYLQKSEEWEVGLIRWRLPSSQIPIFNFASNAYYVTLRPHGGAAGVPVAVTFDPNQTGAVFNQGVYSFQAFVSMVNTALATAYGALVTKPTAAPFIAFNSATQMFSLYTTPVNGGVPGYYSADSAAGSVEIWFNDLLYAFFVGFDAYWGGVPTVQPPPNNMYLNYMVLASNNIVNVVNGATLGFPAPYNVSLYRTDTEFICTEAWNGAMVIIFRSNTMGVTPEYVSAVSTNPSTVISAVTPSNQLANLSLIEDFNIPQDASLNSAIIDYATSGYVRWNDLNIQGPLRSIDLTPQWQDRVLNTFNIYLQYGEVFNVKLAFRRKLGRLLSGVRARVEDEDLSGQ